MMGDDQLKELEADMLAARAEKRIAAARKSAADRAATAANTAYAKAYLTLFSAKRRMETTK
jgi:hypothetical protein